MEPIRPGRRRTHMKLPLLATVGMLVLATACQSATASTPAASPSPSPSAAVSGADVYSLADGRVRADALLDLVKIPHGTSRSTSRDNALADPGWQAESPNLVDHARWWTVP